jgi:hypothetical protein
MKLRGRFCMMSKLKVKNRIRSPVVFGRCVAGRLWASFSSLR